MAVGLSHALLGGALLAAATGLGGYVHGIRVGVDQERATQLRAERAADSERMQLQGQIAKSAEQFQAGEYARQSQVREIFHEREKIVDRPVYRNVCVDADGVLLLDRAAAVANGEHITPTAGGGAQTADRPAQ